MSFALRSSQARTSGRRDLRHRAGAPGRSTPRARSTRSPRGARSATRCCGRLPVRRLRLQDGHARAAPGQPAAAAVGARRRDDQLDRAAQQGARGLPRHDLPELAELPVPLIVNVMGSSAEDVATLVHAFGARDEVAALELNVSCPNVKTGLLMGADPGETAALLDAVRPRDGEAADREADAERRVARPTVAAAAEAHGADAVSLINTRARHGDGPAPAGRAVARRRHRRRVRAGRARRRARAGARGPRAGRARRSSAWAACRPVVMPPTCSTRAPISSAVGTESFRDPLRGRPDRGRARDAIAAQTAATCAARIAQTADKRPANRAVTVKCPRGGYDLKLRSS